MNRRFACALELRFTGHHEGVDYSGRGSTLDLSSGGIRFRPDSPLPVRAKVELRIAWPALLRDALPLELVVLGRVLRIDAGGHVVSVAKHEFRASASPEEHRSVA